MLNKFLAKTCYRSATRTSFKYCFMLSIYTLGFFLASFAPVQAKVTEKDLQVVFRALGFMKSSPGGTLKAAIVHDPGNSASQSEAKQLKSLLKGGYSAKGITLEPVMVKAGNAGDIANTDLAFVTTGISGHYDRIKDIGRSNGIFIVSTDKSCVQAGACTMFVQSTPSVQITVNGETADKAGIAFSSAFGMMVDEI